MSEVGARSSTFWHVTRQVVLAIAHLGLRYRIAHADRVPPAGGLIIASNHVSYSDPPLVGAAVPRVTHFLAKEELFRNAVFGALIRFFHAVPIRRGELRPEQHSRVVALLAQGGVLIMFPEGTRGRNGRRGHPRPGVGIFARDAQVPVVPTLISGSARWRQGRWGGNRVVVSFGAPVPPPPPGADRAAVAAFVEEVMRRVWEMEERPGAASDN